MTDSVVDFMRFASERAALGQAVERRFTEEEKEKLEAEARARMAAEQKRGEIMAVARLAEKLLIADLGKTMSMEEYFEVAQNYVSKVKEELAILEEMQ